MPNIEIKPKDLLTTDQQRALQALTRAVYPPKPPTENPVPQIQWAETTWSVLIWDDEAKLVSHVGMLTRLGELDGKRVLLGGIGGVKTDPNARGRGYAAAGLAQATATLRDQHQVAFSLLVCRDDLLTYYQRFGWQPFRGDLYVEQPEGKVIFTFNKPMVLNGCQTAPQDGVLDLCGMPW